MLSVTAPDPDVSIVVPIYNEFDNLPELVERIDAAMRTQPLSYELIAVDDGSSDGSAQRLRELAETRPWLRAVCLVRNYGQSSALQAGFDRVRGRYVVTLDADLQNEPGDIPLLLARLEADPSVDMISGWRKNRQDKALSRRLPSVLANRLISRATQVQLHDYGCALKAYRRPIIDRIRLYGELHRFIPSLARDAGARIAEVPVRHHARTRGVSKYGIDRTFRVILDLIFMVFFMRFRQRPLHAFGGLGLWLAVPGMLMLAWLLVQKLLGADIGGRPLLLAGVLLVLMGMQFIAVGLVGELLTRIYYESGGGQQYHAHEYGAWAQAQAPQGAHGQAPVPQPVVRAAAST
ncbi:glycosyltransferase family 2 protein [Extensimonas sp. H3M7-6]|uniref:glycosyltransferase family 2 protein n=1 Tax=Extensimonas soli TaxID=3031322 RepID=UPI0023DB8A5A|nr:glycosyltransferase family 2 protein [Extensimonas sp. H3M7-6]MDF1483039.1 glycosyltransferase family 2 protein [Extensimonas sp. H3M7-6]